MTFLKIFFIIFLFLCSNTFIVYSQTSVKEYESLKTVMSPELHNHTHVFKGIHSEVDAVFTGLFVFYKTFISSQDGNSCTFTPSCSEYALQSIKKKGVFLGMLNSFDRLLRCNGLSPKNYPYDYDKHLLIDPVE